MPRRTTSRRPRRTKRTGFTRSAPKSKYRPAYIGSELQLTNRRPQSLTTKISVLRTYYCEPTQGINNFSFIRAQCGSPWEPWHTGSGGFTQGPRWQLKSSIDSTIFTQFGHLYEEAYVLGAKMTAHVKFIGQRNTNALETHPNELQQLVATGVQSNDDATNGALTPSTLPSEVVRKQNFRASRVLMGGNSHAGAPSYNVTSQQVHKQVRSSAYYSPKKLFGIKDVGDFEMARFKLGAQTLADRVPPMYGDGSQGPYFTLGLSHEDDNLGGSFLRTNHNSAYVSIKVDYIMKMVKPTPDRGDNYRGTAV